MFKGKLFWVFFFKQFSNPANVLKPCVEKLKYRMYQTWYPCSTLLSESYNQCACVDLFSVVEYSHTRICVVSVCWFVLLGRNLDNICLYFCAHCMANPHWRRVFSASSKGPQFRYLWWLRCSKGPLHLYKCDGKNCSCISWNSLLWLDATSYFGKAGIFYTLVKSSAFLVHLPGQYWGQNAPLSGEYTHAHILFCLGEMKRENEGGHQGK